MLCPEILHCLLCLSSCWRTCFRTSLDKEKTESEVLYSAASFRCQLLAQMHAARPLQSDRSSRVQVSTGQWSFCCNWTWSWLHNRHCFFLLDRNFFSYNCFLVGCVSCYCRVFLFCDKEDVFQLLFLSSAGPLSSVWKEWVKWCIEFGIEPNAIIAAPYDWRLSPTMLEERDLYFHKLKYVLILRDHGAFWSITHSLRTKGLLDLYIKIYHVQSWDMMTLFFRNCKIHFFLLNWFDN